jgi:stearoyl-CoA desaturase (delta-9 desaturase)
MLSFSCFFEQALTRSSFSPQAKPSHIPSAGSIVPGTGTRTVVLLAVLLPLIAFVVGIFWLWGSGFTGTHLAILLIGFAATSLGITVGYHRLFTHRSFETPATIKATLAILGSMAVEGPLLRWVGTHRIHHYASDQEGDPHSPHGRGRGVIGILSGLWHAHVGWLFEPDPPEFERYVCDLRRDPTLSAISKLFPLWVVTGLLIPALLGGLLTMSWSGMVLGFVWGGLARIFLVHHSTWSINSVCHVWGTRPFRTGDESRNNLILGVLGMGEGWHNNHHAFPTSARHGLRWWQIDSSYYLIKIMSWFGLARKIRLPDAAAFAAKQKLAWMNDKSTPTSFRVLPRSLGHLHKGK